MIRINGNPLTQWDTGRAVTVTDIAANRVHFANKGDSKAVIMELVDGQAKIPDYLLQTGKQICAYAVADGVTIESKSFFVTNRERPENYVYDEDQRNFIYTLIENAQEATKAANQAAEKANLAAQGAGESSLRANAAAEEAEDAAKTAKYFLVVGEANGTPIHLDDATDQYLVGGRIFGKTMQSGVPTPAAPVPLVSAGGDGSVNIRTAGKNLLRCTAATTTNRGITFSVAPDGTILVNGTATENAYLTIGTINLHPGKYLLRGNSSGSSTTHRIFITNGTNEYNNYTADREFTVTESGTWTVRVLVNAGTAVSNLKLYPMVRLASITDPEYERYKTATEMTIVTPNGLCGISVPSGGNYTDANGQQWVCDEIDLDRGVYIQRTGKWIIDGSIVPSSLSEGNNGGTVLVYTYANVMNGISTNRAPKMCDKLQSPTSVNPVSYKDCEVGSWSFNTAMAQDVYLIFNVGELNTEEEVTAYLRANPITFIGILATPIETSMSAEEVAAFGDLRTYRGHTTISNSGQAHMEIEYVMDAKKYIDSLVGTGGSSAGILNATVE